MRRYGYVGAPGGYGEEALLTHFKGGVKPISSPNVLALIQDIQTDQLDGGILPVTPGQEGELLESMGLAQGETFSFQTQQSLLAFPGQDLYDLVQILAQDWVRAACAEFLHDLSVRWGEVPDAAASARQIWQQHLAGVGVVAPARAAALYHLKVLTGIPEGVVHPSDFVLLRRSPARGSSARITRVLTPLEDYPMPAEAANGWHDEPGQPRAGTLPAAARLLPTGRNGSATLALLEAAKAAPLASPDLPSPGYAPTQPAILLTDVCKVYTERQLWSWWRTKKHQAVNHLTLSVQSGEIFGLLGPNGAGKTTTINLLIGLLSPTSGSIHLLGHDVSRPREARQIRARLGVVSQETALYGELTARQNLAFQAGLYGMSRALQQQRIQAVLELVGLLAVQDKRVRGFSGGMKRRLAIARALLHDPALLVLDEPTLGVDVQSKMAIWSHIRALRAQGKTILLTTNLLEEVQALADRIAILDHGTLLIVDTLTHLSAQYGDGVLEVETARVSCQAERLRALPGVTSVSQQGVHLHLRARGMNDQLTAEVLTLLAQEGEVLQFRVQKPTLDEIFLELTGAALRD